MSIWLEMAPGPTLMKKWILMQLWHSQDRLIIAHFDRIFKPVEIVFKTCIGKIGLREHQSQLFWSPAIFECEVSFINRHLPSHLRSPLNHASFNQQITPVSHLTPPTRPATTPLTFIISILNHHCSWISHPNTAMNSNLSPSSSPQPTMSP